MGITIIIIAAIFLLACYGVKKTKDDFYGK